MPQPEGKSNVPIRVESATKLSISPQIDAYVEKN
jgi:hypothetical protein